MLKKLMNQIHDHLEMTELSRDFGTQMYEQQVVELSQTGERGDLAEGGAAGTVQDSARLGRTSRGRSSVLGWGLGGRGPGAWPLRPCAPCRPAAAEAGLQQQRVYALHLRRYNDALFIHDTVRAVDALAALQDFYDRERDTKTQVLRAERWLLALFDGEARGEEGAQNGTSG